MIEKVQRVRKRRSSQTIGEQRYENEHEKSIFRRTEKYRERITHLGRIAI